MYQCVQNDHEYIGQDYNDIIMHNFDKNIKHDDDIMHKFVKNIEHDNNVILYSSRT